VTIRNIDDAVKQSARLAAAKNGRSLEAELRLLLEHTYRDPDAERKVRLRAMSGKDAIEHLIRIADGAGDGVFDKLEPMRFREFDL
jgi:plasmid stability protein